MTQIEQHDQDCLCNDCLDENYEEEPIEKKVSFENEQKQKPILKKQKLEKEDVIEADSQSESESSDFDSDSDSSYEPEIVEYDMEDYLESDYDSSYDPTSDEEYYYSE